jgi:hypothetical protein
VKTPTRTFAIGGGLIAFFLAGLIALHLVVRSEWLRARAQSELSERTGYEVRIGSLRLSPWLSLIASEITVAGDQQAIFEAKTVTASLSPLDLFSGRISRLSLERPVVRLSLEDLSEPSEGAAPRFSIGTLNIDDGEIVLDTGHGAPLALRSIFLDAENLSLEGEAGLEISTRVPAVNGTARLALSGVPEMRRIEIAVVQDLEQTRASLPAATEKTAFEAGFQISRKPSGYEIEGSGSFDQFRLANERIDGRFDSTFDFDTRTRRLALSVDLKMPRIPSASWPETAPLDLGPVALALRGSYSAEKNSLVLEKIDLVSGRGKVDGRGVIDFGESPAGLNANLRLRDLEIESLKPLMPPALASLAYQGKVGADFKLSGAYKDPVIAGAAWSDAAKIDSDRISFGQVSSRLPFQWSDSMLRIKAGRLEARDVRFEEEGKTRWSARAASVRADLGRGPKDPFEIAAEFQILDGGFTAPGAMRIGERLTVKGSFACRDCGGDASFSGEARIETLELLWDKFFGDFKNQKPSVKVRGSYRRAADELALDPLEISLGLLDRLQLRGSVRRPLDAPAFDVQTRAEGFRLAQFYDFLIRDTFKASYPLLGQIGLSGQSAFTARAQGSTESFTLEGRLRLEEGSIRERSGRWRIGPMTLDLPLSLRYPEAREGSLGGAPPTGSFSIQEIEAASTKVPRISAPVSLWNNALRFPAAIDVELFGGSLRIERLRWNDVVGAPADLSFSLGIGGLRLLELTEALGWHQFGGTLSGSIPDVRWEADSLKIAGGVVLDVFGGRVAIRELEVERPLSPVRSIRMGATLENLDLEQASATFEFGRISGVVQGKIEDLVIMNGQPAEFRADIQTVEKSGVGQWISVEALNKITVLSSGNEAGAIYGGIAGFFDFFRYSKLGFKASLKNDKMTLRGIETRNGQEYLVVGTLLPPTVNIVSHTQEISFGELMRRLERVTQS